MFTLESKHVTAILISLVFVLGFVLIADKTYRVELTQRDGCSEDEDDEGGFPDISQKELDDVLSIDKAFAGALSKVQTKTDTSIPLFEVEGLWVQGHVFPRNTPFTTEDDEDQKQMGMFVHILPDNAYLPEQLKCSLHENDKVVRKLSLITFSLYDLMYSDIQDGSHLAVLCSGNSKEYLVVSVWGDSIETLDVDRSRNGMGNSCYDESDDDSGEDDDDSFKKSLLKAWAKQELAKQELAKQGLSKPFSLSYSACPAWGLVSPKNPDDLAALKKKQTEPTPDAGL
jgi:hypothetical protein